jgi:hypothetical protein
MDSAASRSPNVRSQGEGDAVLGEAARAGAPHVKPGAKADWGGYVGYFTDLDGHLWEIAWNPGFALDATGGIVLAQRRPRTVAPDRARSLAGPAPC